MRSHESLRHIAPSPQSNACNSPVQGCACAFKKQPKAEFNPEFLMRISGTATAANGVLYVATMTDLFALKKGAQRDGNAPQK